MQKILFLSAAMLVFAACGGGGGGKPKSGDIDYKVSLKLDAEIASAAKQATFCIDRNGNSQCDEPDAKVAKPNETVSFSSADKRLQTFSLLAVVMETGGSSYPVAHKPATDGSTSTLSFVSTLEAAFKSEGKSADYERILKTINPNSNFKSNLKSLIKLLTKEHRFTVELAYLTEADLKSMLGVLNDSGIKKLDESIKKALAEKWKNALILHKTGITKFYDGETENGKDTELDEYKGQDASTKKGKDFKWEKLDKDGNTLSESVTDYACVKDKETGLVWEIKSDDESSPNYKFSTFVLRTKSYSGSEQEFENYETTREAKKLKDGGLSFVAIPKKDKDGKPISAIKCNLNDGKDVKACTTENYANYLNEFNGGKGYCGKKNWRLPKTAEFYNIADLSLTADEKNSIKFEAVVFRPSNDYSIKKDTTKLYKSLPDIFNDIPTQSDVKFSKFSDGLEALLKTTQGKSDGCTGKIEECKAAIQPYINELYTANVKGFTGVEDYFAYWLDDFTASYESKDEEHPENVTLVINLNSFNALGETPSDVRTSSFGSCQRVYSWQKEEDLCLYKTALPVRMVAKD